MRFNVAKTILRLVPQASRSIKHKEQKINWCGIQNAQLHEGASEKEKALVRLARDCYFCENNIADIAKLDPDSRMIVLNAISCIFGYPQFEQAEYTGPTWADRAKE